MVHSKTKISALKKYISRIGYDSDLYQSEDPLVEDDILYILDDGDQAAHVQLTMEGGMMPCYVKDEGKIVFGPHFTDGVTDIPDMMDWLTDNILEQR